MQSAPQEPVHLKGALWVRKFIKESDKCLRLLAHIHKWVENGSAPKTNTPLFRRHFGPGVQWYAFFGDGGWVLFGREAGLQFRPSHITAKYDIDPMQLMVVPQGYLWDPRDVLLKEYQLEDKCLK